MRIKAPGVEDLTRRSMPPLQLPLLLPCDPQGMCLAKLASLRTVVF